MDPEENSEIKNLSESYRRFNHQSGTEVSIYPASENEQYVVRSGKYVLVNAGDRVGETHFRPEGRLNHEAGKERESIIAFAEGLQSFFEAEDANNAAKPTYIIGGPTNIRNALFAERFGFQLAEKQRPGSKLPFRQQEPHKNLDSNGFYRIGKYDEVREKVQKFVTSGTFQKLKAAIQTK